MEAVIAAAESLPPSPPCSGRLSELLAAGGRLTPPAQPSSPSRSSGAASPTKAVHDADAAPAASITRKVGMPYTRSVLIAVASAGPQA